MDKSTLRQRARNLRQNSTDAERHLWYHLRANRPGFKLRRQVLIGSYIVDFVCIEKRLIIELDGG
ncbi:TPA: endonuclease domain-containing protein, partial [Legionella pneumophila]